MRLHSPIIITPRLLPGVQVGGGAFVSIQWSDRPGDDGRARAKYFIDLPGGEEFTADDLQSGCGGASLQSMLETLLAFLGAAAESHSYDVRRGGDGSGGENSDLFPANVREWAADNSDELGSLQVEISETPDLITAD